MFFKYDPHKILIIIVCSTKNKWLSFKPSKSRKILEQRVLETPEKQKATELGLKVTLNKFKILQFINRKYFFLITCII